MQTTQGQGSWLRRAAAMVPEAAAFLLLTVLIIALWQQNYLLLALISAEAGLLLAHWHAPSDVSAFALIGLLGSLAEVAFVHFGVWRYANPSCYGIPIWFPVAFGTAGLLGVRLSTKAFTLWQGMQR